MRLRTGVVWLAVLMSLVVLAALVWKTQQRELSASGVAERMQEFARAEQAIVRIDAELVRLRVEREDDFATLESAMRAWDEANAALAAAEWTPALAQQLNAYMRVVAQGATTLADARALQSRFSQAFMRFRAQAETSLKQMVVAGSAAETQRLVPLLADELARYSLQSRPTNGDALDSLIKAVPARFNTLALAAGELREAKDGLQVALHRWAALAPLSALQRVSTQLNEGLQRQERNRDTYSVALAAYAGALLLVFGIIALRLQHSMRALDAINADLEKAVNERTQDLHKALNELRMQQAHLVQSEKMASLGQMVAGVAHEINTPLGYASSNVETIKDSLTVVFKAGGLSTDSTERLEEAEVLLEDALHGLGQIDELVKSLKNFSRVDRSHTELFDLNEGLDTALKICQNTLKERIEVEKDYASDLPEILCAPSQLNQVFLNLINNGAQAISGPGTIYLSTRRDGEFIDVRVRDSGCGMDEETRAHIFEPFFTTKPVGEGTGLGLSIVFRIVEDHGGVITVDSAPGAGTEFCIRLPIRVEATAGSDPIPQSAVILDDEEEAVDV